MSIPLSRVGITKEDLELLSNRLFPAANEIFLKNLARDRGVKFEDLQMLDYSSHPVFIRDMMMNKRHIKSDYLKNIDTSKWDYPYKNIEEAQALDKDSKHIQIGTNALSLAELELKNPKRK